MIQLNLMKAKASCDELDRLTPKFIDEAKDKVEKVYKLSKQISSVMNDSDINYKMKEYFINDYNSQIMALTQGIE